MFLWIWVTLLIVFFIVSAYMEKKAAMRGSHRTPLPEWAEVFLRTYFYLLLVIPLCAWSPWICFPLALLYYPTFIDGSERNGKRRSEWVASWRLWGLIKWYFKLEVVSDIKLDKTKQYIIGMHPHGFLPIGTIVNMSTTVSQVDRILNGVHPFSLAASFCFYIPGYRDIILAAGVLDAARYNARRVLDQGGSLQLVPGGATEALYAQPGVHIVYLKSRKGFVKLAMETGASLVPVYSFGEVECYRQLSSAMPSVKKFQKKFQAIFGLSLPLVTNIIPRRAHIVTAFGTPIPVPKMDNPTDAQVQDMLDLYCKGLQAVFNMYAPRYIEKEAERVLQII
jgi:2-acylglycerol O-acyltransferase 2